MTTNILDKETATVEFDRFANLMDLDLDPADMDEKDLKSLEVQKSLIIKGIMSGAVTINDNGEPSYTPRRSDNINTITFHEPTGASLMAMDQRKKDADVSKMYAMMADMTAEPAKRFAAMKLPDLKVCQAITALFTG